MSGKSFIEKHKPLTKKEVEDKLKQQADIRKQFTTDAVQLEKNLADFNNTLDPLVNPEDNKPLCWIRRPSQAEWEEMVPSELMEYRTKPADEIPEKVWEKYKDFQFEMMAKLIENPKHDKDWWKKNSNLVFQQLFQMHLTSILEQLGISAENF